MNVLFGAMAVADNNAIGNKEWRRDTSCLREFLGAFLWFAGCFADFHQPLHRGIDQNVNVAGLFHIIWDRRRSGQPVVAFSKGDRPPEKEKSLSDRFDMTELVLAL